MNPPVPRWAATFLALAIIAPVIRAAEDAWSRAAIPGFTVYSDLPEAETRRRLAALLLTMDDFSRIWPTPQEDGAAPGLIVFCGRPDLYSEVCPTFARRPEFQRGPTEIFLNTRYAPQDGPRPHIPSQGYYFKYPPLLDVWNDHLLQRAYSAYFQRLVGERVPPWLWEGLGRLMEGMCCLSDSIVFPAFKLDPTMAGRRQTGDAEAALRAALARGQFLPLERLLAEQKPLAPIQLPYYVGRNGRYTIGPDNRGFWITLPVGPFINEAYELAYFGLFADGGRHRAGFVRFAQAASNGPLDEAALRGCLGMDGPELQRELWRWTAPAGDRAYPLPPRPGPPAPTAASLVFHPARPEELGEMTRAWSEAKATGFGYGSRSSPSWGEEIRQTIYDPLLDPVSESGQ
ncbi:MAG TPA: hypothetical protein VHC86_00655 [Opitutaceae bacterium]|nr:hypothetical protein [Opitutaceae bacterium]